MSSANTPVELMLLCQAINAVRNGASQCVSDSRAVKPGDVFLALRGATFAATQFIDTALAAGAALVIADSDGVEPAMQHSNQRVLWCAGLSAAQGRICAWFYGQPSAALQLVGITGTNGKTTSAVQSASALSNLGNKVGLIGTLGVGVVDATQNNLGLVSTGLTTPSAAQCQQAMAQFLRAGCRYAVMEVSSIALHQGRVYGLRFEVAAFTNLSQDHLDYHGDMAQYQAAKAQLFAWPSLSSAVVQHSSAGLAMAKAFLAAQPQGQLVWTSLQPLEPVFVGDEVLHRSSADATSPAAPSISTMPLQWISRDSTMQLDLPVSLLGEHNQANLLTVLGVLRCLGIDASRWAQAVGQLAAVPGRMQMLGGDAQPAVIVDYAHTPDGLSQLLQTTAALAQSRGGRHTVVFGAGGNRDAAKRPLMGQAAAQWADDIVITNDNPRGETPEAIAHAIAQGVQASGKSAHIILDRRSAIAHTIALAHAADVVVLAGMGHEQYQTVGQSRVAHSDSECARSALAQWKAPV